MHHLYADHIEEKTLPRDLEELLEAYHDSLVERKSNVEFALIIHISNMLTYIKDSHPDIYEKYTDEYLAITEKYKSSH